MHDHMSKYLTCEPEVELNNNTIPSFQNIYHITRRSRVKNWLWGSLLLLVLLMFLPWTQNIRATGLITTLRQEQRPQQLNSVIGGRVEKWWVKEGDFVQKGDTILQLGEVKVEYFDPALLERTGMQITAKEYAGTGYENKAQTAEQQVGALEEGRTLKLSQLDIKLKQQQLKVESDSMDVNAVLNELNVAKRQIDAAKAMLDSGVIALVDYERRKINFQNATAKRIGAENKLLQSKQELTALRIEKNAVVQEYADKIAKAKGEQYSAISEKASNDAEVAKLKNAYANYDMRNKLYYVTAPQSGQITKARKAGIGELLKEGDMIVEIVPDKIQYAVEMFVSPMDMPLLSRGQKIRFVFDGFPAIVFSGWPSSSYGTFGGIVTAIENSVSVNGKFRVLVTEDPAQKPWPRQLRIGGGANGIALLKDVTVGYELWRNINGFPPEYYQPVNPNKDNGK